MSRRPWADRIPDLGEGATFLRKWGLVGFLVGVASGAGALALIWLIGLVNGFALITVVGYVPPLPDGEGGAGQYAFHMARPWLLPLVTGAAGLAGGLLVWRLAPETAGIGTNAAIRAFHHNERIGLRTAAVKLVTSAITIGGGLTSGREGPIAQIGAATGSAVGRVLKLTPRERNVALAAGLGAGIAAIFKAPLAGAIIGAEIFYTEDFEVDALVPGLIASVVGYAIVGSVMGFQPIFMVSPNIAQFGHPSSLVLYGIVGAGCALLARFLVAFYGRTERYFKHFPLWLATAVGGFGAGMIGLGVPSVLGTGYGWVQFAVSGNVAMLPPLMLLAAAVAEIVSASLTLGSGNSGGVFGPCVMVGGMFGGACGYAAASLFPGLGLQPGSFAVVGMMAFFAAAAKAPISTIIMISEMTGGYGLLAPAMVAVGTAFVLSGKRSIFPAQVASRIDSPFHADEFEPMVLLRVKTRDIMTRPPACVSVTASVADAMASMGDHGVSGLPVEQDSRLCGWVTLLAAYRVPAERRQSTRVDQIMSRRFFVAYPDEDLFTVLRRLAANDVGNLAVVEREKPDIPIGMITRSGLWAALERAKRQHAVGGNAVSPPDEAAHPNALR